MNASQIINDEMTLSEKLSAIERAMENALEMAKADAKKNNRQYVPIDPSDLTICDGCE